MSKIEKTALAHAGVLFGLGVLLSIFNQTYFEQTFILEDGVLEWLTVLALGTAAFVTAQRIWQGFGILDPKRRFTLVVIFTLCFFGAGEEISWGQRLFNIESPEFFKMNNAQKETNLHNIRIKGVNINKLIFGKIAACLILLYLGVITPLYHRSEKIRARIDSWGIPIPKRYQWISYLIVAFTVEVVVNALSDTHRRGELSEFGLCVILALNIIYPYNRQTLDPEQTLREEPLSERARNDT